MKRKYFSLMGTGDIELVEKYYYSNENVSLSQHVIRDQESNYRRGDMI